MDSLCKIGIRSICKEEADLIKAETSDGVSAREIASAAGI